MLATRNLAQTLLSRCKLSPILTQMAGLQSYEPPRVRKDIEYPERRRLKVLEKVPTPIPGTRLFKMQKKLRLMRGPEPVHNFLLHRQFGIVAEGGGRLKHGHIEMVRMTLLRKMDTDRMFAIWRIDPPWHPVTKKSQGQRMGGGKGAINHYVTPIKRGRIIMEVAGDCEFFEVKNVLTEIADKLPFKARAVTQEMMDEMQQEEKELEENNLHPWTWKYIIQNNMLGCNIWLSRYDRLWFTKYI